MPEIVPVRPDDTWLADLLDRVDSGGDIVLAKGGRSVARLVRVEAQAAKGDAKDPEFKPVVGMGLVMMPPPEEG